MKSSKLAKRPVKFDYSSSCGHAWDTDRFKLILDANDIHEWKLGNSVPELSHSVYEVHFYNINNDVLGTVLVDLCEYGSHLHQEICDTWYESRHPWLDYKDAVKKGVFHPQSGRPLLLRHCDYFYETSYEGLHETFSEDVVAFKPITSFEFAYFNTVNAWKEKV